MRLDTAGSRTDVCSCLSVLSEDNIGASVVFPWGSPLLGEGYRRLRENTTKYHVIKLIMALSMQDVNISNHGVTML